MELIGIILSIIVLDEVISLATVDLSILEAPGGVQSQLIIVGWLLGVIRQETALVIVDILLNRLKVVILVFAIGRLLQDLLV